MTPGIAEIRRAADVIRGFYQRNVKIEVKADKTPVTEADVRSEEAIRDLLTKRFPTYGFYGEETGKSDMGAESVWLVDPIDGTRDFIRGRSGWSVSVALVSAGRPLLGMLDAPARGEFWYAEAGKGSWRNGKRLVASQRKHLAGARVPAHALPKSDADLTAVDQPNSIALRIAMVAADEADLVATLRWGYEWDIGAAALIAREAGAAVTDAFGQPLGYNKRDPRAFGVLVCSSAIHQAAVDRLAGRARELAQSE